MCPRPPSDDLIAENNACGNAGWSCIVFADRSVRPLEFNAAAPEFRIIQERGSDSLFRVLPGNGTRDFRLQGSSLGDE
jgi:hypothetical protein